MMAVPKISRRLTFCAGHRVVGHEGKCRNLHGHNYVVYVKARAQQLDSVGRVIDFSVLKEKVGGWINERWDHKFVLWQEDEVGIEAVRRGNGATVDAVFLLPSNPTAENLATYLLHVVCPSVLYGTGVEVFRVIVEETENCSAEACL